MDPILKKHWIRKRFRSKHEFSKKQKVFDKSTWTCTILCKRVPDQSSWGNVRTINALNFRVHLIINIDVQLSTNHPCLPVFVVVYDTDDFVCVWHPISLWVILVDTCENLVDVCIENIFVLDTHITHDYIVGHWQLITRFVVHFYCANVSSRQFFSCGR